MSGLLRFFLRYGVWADALVFVIVLLGGLALRDVKRGFFPELEDRTIVVRVAYPGASPEELERTVVQKVEQGVEGIPGIEEYISTARENLAEVKVIGRYGYDHQVLLSDVKNAVDEISSFPPGAERPVVFLKRRQDPVLTLALQSTGALIDLKPEVERVKDALIALPNVSQVAVEGLPTPEVEVAVSEAGLRTYGLDFAEVAAAVQANNRDLTLGQLRGQEEELILRLWGESPNPDSIAQLVLRSTPDGRLVRVGDVATVSYKLEEVPERSFYNGKPAVVFKITKLNTEDLLDIVATTKAFIAQYNQRGGAQLFVVDDRSVSLIQRITLLVNNGGVGLVLVLLILGLFLSPRAALWVALGIPVAFLGMFLVTGMLGLSINMLSLFGMILVVGILVDDGIVISENVYAKYELGATPYQAAFRGTMEVMPSVLASILTTIIAFVPIYFVEGVLGEYVSEMATFVIIALVFSLVEAGIVLPSHMLHYNAMRKGQRPGRFRRGMDRFIDHLRFRVYAPALRVLLRFRYVAFAGFLAVGMVIAGLFVGNHILFLRFPPIDFGRINIELVLRPGTPSEGVQQQLFEVQAMAFQLGERFQQAEQLDTSYVKDATLRLGSTSTASGEHTGTLSIQLADAELRRRSTEVFKDSLRAAIPPIADAEQFAVVTNTIFGLPISFRVLNADSAALRQSVAFIKARLRSYPELRDIIDNQQTGKREVRFRLKPKAYALGFNRSSLLGQVRSAFFGQEIQRLQVGSDEVKVWVRYPLSNRRKLTDLHRMQVVAPNGNRYPLIELVDLAFGRSTVVITHYNGKREVLIEADQASAGVDIVGVDTRIMTELQREVQARWPGTSFYAGGQNKEATSISNVYLGKPGLLVLFGLLLLITLSLRSLPQAFLFLLLIPFGILFAILGHGIEGRALTLFSFIGIIALMGIIVNDAIVYADRYNRNLRKGQGVVEAIQNAGVQRFRAILLTSITTVVGLYPLILETSAQAQFLIPMAISVAYGVLFTTLIVLLLFPVLLLMLSDLRVLMVWLWRGERPTREAVEPAVRELHTTQHLETPDEEV